MNSVHRVSGVPSVAEGLATRAVSLLSQEEWDKLEAIAFDRKLDKRHRYFKPSRGYDISVDEFIQYRLCDSINEDDIILDLHLLDFPVYVIYPKIRRGERHVHKIINDYKCQLDKSSSDSVDTNNQERIQQPSISAPIFPSSPTIDSPLQTP